MNPTCSSFSEEDLKLLDPFLKIGLLATINPDGLPHLTFISSLRPNTPTQLTFGQFSEGKSKEFIQQNPKVGFLMMTLQKDLWRGKATFTHTAKQGAEYDYYNNVPMFRYNSYFGVHTVYYLDLLYHLGRQRLPMNEIIPAALMTILAKTLSPQRPQTRVFNHWTHQLLGKLDTLKFLAYIDGDGYPMIIPIIQAQPASFEHLLFSARVYDAELQQIQRGMPVVILGMALSMEDVLLRGEFLGLQRRVGILCGEVKIDWVYNSMPPAPGQIYPPLPLEAVQEF